jgi:hypothetical protein
MLPVRALQVERDESLKEKLRNISVNEFEIVVGSFADNGYQARHSGSACPCTRLRAQVYKIIVKGRKDRQLLS